MESEEQAHSGPVTSTFGHHFGRMAITPNVATPVKSSGTTPSPSLQTTRKPSGFHFANLSFAPTQVSLKCDTCTQEEGVEETVQRSPEIGLYTDIELQRRVECDDNGACQTVSDPTHCNPVVTDKPCQVTKSPAHPSDVSQVLIDRILGKYSGKDGDPGEGGKQVPYIYVAPEGVCTVGHGHQIQDKKKDADGNIEKNEQGKDKLRCNPNPASSKNPKECICDPPYPVPDPMIRLRKDLNNGIKYVHKQVQVDLNQNEFDAMVDLTLHVGSIPKAFLEEIHKSWCTNKAGVRDKYLSTALTMKDPRTKKQVVMDNFVKRRKFRVWPADCTPEDYETGGECIQNEQNQQMCPAE